MRIQTGQTERIRVTMLDGALAPLTGLSNVLLSIERDSDGHGFDFADLTFKAGGWTTRYQVMTETPNAWGKYHYDFDTPTITNPVADDTYTMTADCVSAANVPQDGELKVGQFVDNVDASIASRQSEVSAGLRSVANITEHGNTQAAIAALPIPPTAAAITAAILNRALAGHLTPGTVGHAMLVSLSVPQQNVVIDGGAGLVEIVYDSNGLMTSGRRRSFATPGAATAATPGAVDGADGEISLVMYTGVAHSTLPKLPGVYRGVGE